MFQQNGENNIQNAGTGNANLKGHLKAKSREELALELDRLLENESATGQEADLRIIQAYLEAMEEKENLENVPGDFEHSWAIFKKQHPELLPEKKIRKRRKISFARVLEVAVLICAIIVASVAAFDWPSHVVYWGRDVFGFSPSELSGAMELSEPDENGYQSLHEATVDVGVPDLCVPNWIPSEYSIGDIHLDNSLFFYSLTAVYQNGEHDIVVRILYYPDSTEMPNLELEISSDIKGEKYRVSGIEHLITNNYDQTRATWKTEHCICSISGYITMQEMKEMINSIYW